ncbi:Magnesium-dependent phosphatase 1 [Rhizophlyctis rosea]|uniref:Magnesium-dependent phosphatase 1 n=1 Tax=Rhizophlyctis rosea TaxID=64517 RepID=A0AAD5S3D6_9FUNG|nr:Magnesium-dependent phosphatase 1 [Rhizophlyctis rosea]
MTQVQVDFSRFTHMPQLICFDLDYTIWPLTQGFSVADRSGNKVSIYSDLPAIFRYLKERHPEIKLAIASRTHAPEYADVILDLLHVAPAHFQPPVGKSRSTTEPNPVLHPPLKSFFDVFEIYPSDKQAHFKSIHKKTSIPFENMLFFDDERRNIISVGKLGVTCVDVGRTGTTLVNFMEGLQKYQERRKGGEMLKGWLKGAGKGLGKSGLKNEDGEEVEFTVTNGR